MIAPTLTCLLGFGLVLAAPPTERERREQRRFEATLATLNKPVDQVQFDKMPLEEVLDWLRDQGLKSMIVHWNAIEEHVGIDRDAPISLALADTSVGEVLDWSLAVASELAVEPEEQLTYHVDRGVLVISSARHFKNKIVTRVYDIADVVQPVPWYDPEKGGAMLTGRQRAQLRRAATVDADGGREVNPPPGYEMSRRGSLLDIKEAHVVELIDALYTLKPETWERNGGRGWIRRFKDQLIVAQTFEVHEMIGGTRTVSGKERP